MRATLERAVACKDRKIRRRLYETCIAHIKGGGEIAGYYEGSPKLGLSFLQAEIRLLDGETVWGVSFKGGVS